MSSAITVLAGGGPLYQGLFWSVVCHVRRTTSLPALCRATMSIRPESQETASGPLAGAPPRSSTNAFHPVFESPPSFHLWPRVDVDCRFQNTSSRFGPHDATPGAPDTSLFPVRDADDDQVL